MRAGSTRPEQLTLMTRMSGGYWSLATPARSAAPYAHQMQQKAMILGLCSSAISSPR
jgi:hypothetical protein